MNKDKNSLNTYLDEISHRQLLSDEEERELADRIQKGDARAIDRLTAANLTFVVSLAHQYEKRGLATEDLISEGNIAMLQAATRFDGAMGKRFVTFAAPYIREAMEQAIEQQAGLYRVPRDVADTKIEKRRSRALSIDAPLGGSPNVQLGQVLPDVNASLPDSGVESEGVAQQLHLLIGQLNDREGSVMRMLYPSDGTIRTMAEVAEIMGLKRERVRQIRQKAIRRIVKMTRDTMVKDYLKD